MRRVKEISGKYVEGKYPGKEIIENYAVFLKSLLEVTDSSSFLKKVSDEKDELIGQRQKVEPVISFFTSKQVEIFRRLSKQIENFRRNAPFLSANAKSDVNEIEGILASDEPYSLIKLLPPLESRVGASLDNSLSELKPVVQDKLVLAKEDLERELAGHDNFTDEFKRSVIDTFNDVETNIFHSDDCASVKLQSGAIDESQRQAYGLIESCIGEIRDKKSGYGAGGSIEEGVPVKIIETSTFTTKKNIETEEDLDEYLENLRAAMQKILKENNKIKVL